MFWNPQNSAPKLRGHREITELQHPLLRSECFRDRHHRPVRARGLAHHPVGPLAEHAAAAEVVPRSELEPRELNAGAQSVTRNLLKVSAHCAPFKSEKIKTKNVKRTPKQA